MNSKKLIQLVTVVLLSTAPILSQTPSVTPATDEQRQAAKDLEHKALGMLDEVIKDSESFKHLENQVRVRASAAFLLWKHDEKRARAIFREAMESLSDLLKEDVDDSPEARRMLEGPRALRGEMLQMLAQRDPRMARELLRASRPSSSQGGDEKSGNDDYTRQLDLNLAGEIATSDPKLAAEIARESLSQGLSFQLPTLVSQIREKDPETAARLAGDLLAKLRTERLDANGEARNLAIGLLQISTELREEPTKPGSPVSTPLLDQMAIQELADMVTKEALRAPTQNAELLATLQSMMPVIEKYAPGRVAQLRAKAPAAAPATDEDGAPSLESQHEMAAAMQLMEKGTAEEILAAASKAPEGMRDMYYQQAATKLLAAGDAEGARQIINRMQDPAQKAQAMLELEKLVALSSAGKGKPEDYRKLLAQLKTPEERALLLVELATNTFAKGDKKTAVRFLDEARGMVTKRAKNFNQLLAQLIVARGYSMVEPSRALDMLEPIVDQLNELLGAATVLGGFFAEDIVRDDEIMLSVLSGLMSSGFMTQYVGDVTALAKADFDRTKAIADRFQRYEIRALMRLILAQSILAPPTDNFGMIELQRSARLMISH